MTDNYHEGTDTGWRAVAYRAEAREKILREALRRVAFTGGMDARIVADRGGSIRESLLGTIGPEALALLEVRDEERAEQKKVEAGYTMVCGELVRLMRVFSKVTNDPLAGCLRSESSCLDEGDCLECTKRHYMSAAARRANQRGEK